YFRHWKTEERIPVSDTHFLVREPATGRVLGMATITRDVSELRRALEAAQLATRARDSVLGVVAHDLRSPVSTVVMHAGLLRRVGGDPEQLRARADTIERAANRMLRLIQDLLDVRRLESGRLAIECERTAVGAVVRDAVEAARPAARTASVALE